MDNSYRISQVLESVFGVESPVFIPPSSFIPPQEIKGFSGVTIKLEEFAETKTSWMGTPIVMPLYFKGGPNIKMYNETGQITENRFGDFMLPAASLIDFSREKLFSETKVSGGYGTVKEVYGLDDWQITIRGVCLDEPGVRTAQQQKKSLLMWESVVDGIEVYGQVFDQMLVFRIFIKKATFREIEGRPSTIPFELECISDMPIELELGT